MDLEVVGPSRNSTVGVGDRVTGRRHGRMESQLVGRQRGAEVRCLGARVDHQAAVIAEPESEVIADLGVDAALNAGINLQRETGQPQIERKVAGGKARGPERPAQVYLDIDRAGAAWMGDEDVARGNTKDGLQARLQGVVGEVRLVQRI